MGHYLALRIQHLFSRIHTHDDELSWREGGGSLLSLPPLDPPLWRRENTYVKRPPPPPPPPHTGIYCVCCLLMGEEGEEVVVVEGGEALWVGRLGASVRGFLEEGGVNGGS